MPLTRFCLQNPVAVTLAYTAIGILGLLGLTRMGRGILPPVAFPTVVITSTYPGASSAEMERLVVEPLEDQLEDLPELDRVSASAQDATARLTVRFRFGADLASARANVQQAVNAAQANLPTDLVAPTVSRDDAGQGTVIEAAVSSPLLPPAAVAELIARTVVPALHATAGVGAVTIAGQSTRQFVVAPREGALEALGATPLDLLRIVSKSNDVLPGGTFRTPVLQSSVGIRAAALSPEQIFAFPFALPGATAVRVGDVARVRDGAADQELIARVDGTPAIVIAIGGARDADSIRTIRAVRATFAHLEQQLPLLRFETLRSDQPSIDAAAGGVLQTLGEGVILTVLVVLIFLRAWRNAAIAAVAIPCSLAAAFAAMWMLGFTVNVLSLMGLSLTIGILVDDSIVIIEAITRSAARGLAPDAAALEGRRELGAAAFAITLVDVAVFAPIALIDGLVGEFMREFGLVIVIATAFSLLVSFTLTPLLTARWALRVSAAPVDFSSYRETQQTARAGAARRPWTLRSEAASHVIAAWHAALEGFNAGEARLRRAYARRWLPAAWRYRRAVAAAASIACAASLTPLFLGAIPTEFSPPISRGEVRLDVALPPGSTLANTDAVASRLAERLLRFDDVRHVITMAGRGSDGTVDVVAGNRAQVSIVLADTAAAGNDVLDRVRGWQRLEPNASFAGSGTGMGGRPAVSYNLTGPAGALSAAAGRLAGVLAANPAAADVRASDGTLAPRIEIEIDSARALMLGIAPDDAAQTARIETGGAIATKARLESGLVDVVVRGDAAGRGDIDRIRHALVRAGNGALVPLGDVASIRLRRVPAVIARENRERIVTVSANTIDGAPIGLVTAPVAAALRTAGFLPAGVRIAPRGDVEQFLDTLLRIAAALALSVLVVYAILAALYRSYLLPVVIMATVPLAAVGAFGLLYALNVAHALMPGVALLRSQTLNLYSMLGIVLLVGLVAKNGILLVEYAERDVRTGAEPFAAIRRAAERRFRPILMTTLAMIAGMLPLALGDTVGAEYRKALGTVVIGGLSSSLLLTLFVVPLAYAACPRKPRPPGRYAPSLPA